MSNKTNLISNFVLLAGFLVAVLIVGVVAPAIGIRNFYTLLSVPIFVVINTVFHELAHIIAGNLNGFKTVGFKLVCFRFYKSGKKLKCSYCGFGEQIGEAEIIPTKFEDIEKRYLRVAIAGIIANVVLVVLTAICMIFWNKWYLNTTGGNWAFYLTAYAMPISLYFVLCNALPMSSDLSRNDGAMVLGVKKGHDDVVVMFSLMKAHALIYQGKTPSEVPAEYYFDLPQLPEDDPYFIVLLNNRYCYYLDKGDYENAKEVSKRLESLYDYMDKSTIADVQADMLYNYCTFMFDEEQADNLMEDNERFLNRIVSARNIRAKLCYVLYVLKDKELAKEFYEKALLEADSIEIKGLSDYERKLIKRIDADLFA